jgi:Restriction endonuclease
MERLSFDEIRDWADFEDLVAMYFRHQESDPANNVFQVEVLPSGKGSDGGRDLLVKFQVNDSVRPFFRLWVVQCKFYENDLKKSDLADVNIPTLIHQYKADGYLLVCKQGIVNTLATAFEDLNKNCRFGYSYVIWTGQDFISRIHVAPKELRKQFFPKYYSKD